MVDQAAYQSLKKVASFYMSKERVNHTLCPTALVNEAYIQYQSGETQQQKLTFQAAAANSMRQILVNHARSKNALKRGGDRRQTFIVMEDQIATPSSPIDVIHLDEALNRLEMKHPNQARIVELRYFSGMSNQEIATELATSVATIKRKWTFAKAWLFREMR